MEYTFNNIKEAVFQGREIEFSVQNVHYFISRESDDKWYLLNCKDQIYQYFNTSQDLINQATINGKPLLEQWENIIIDFVL